MSGKTSTDSKRKYNEKAYDRLYITVPKGDKDKISKYALDGQPYNTSDDALCRCRFLSRPDLS